MTRLSRRPGKAKKQALEALARRTDLTAEQRESAVAAVNASHTSAQVANVLSSLGLVVSVATGVAGTVIAVLEGLGGTA